MSSVRSSQPAQARINWANPITRGLRFAWVNTAGVDAAGGRLPSSVGTVTNNLALGAQFAASSALVFGTGQLQGLSGYTLALQAYARASGLTENVFHNSSGVGGSPSYLQALICGFTGGGALEIGHSSGLASTYPRATTGAFTGDTLARAVGTYDGTNIRAYVNGALVATTAAGAPDYSADQRLQIASGDGPDLVNSYRGFGIRFAFVWNRALTEAEIRSIDANPWQVFAAPGLRGVSYLPAASSQIITQPQSTNALLGSTATFSVVATGSPTYQWQDNSSGSFANIAGATSSSYTTAATTSAFQRRQYRCVIDGTLNSQAATLTLSFTDVYLLPMPEDADPDDVRLRDPTAALAGNTNLAAAPAALCTVTAGLSTQIRLAATPANLCTVTAALTTGIPLASTPANLCTLSAALTTQIQLAAAPAALCTINAALAGDTALAATPAALCTVTAALTTQIRLTATPANLCTVTAALSTGIQLASAPANVSTITAALTTQIQLAAAPAALCTITAGLAGDTALAAAPAALCTITAGLTTQIRLAATPANVCTVTAALTTGIQLAATPANVSTVTAALTTQIQLAAAPAVVCTITPTLAGDTALAATPAVACTINAGLTTQIRLAAAPANVCTVTAALSTGIRLAAAPADLTTITGALTTQIRLAAAPANVCTISATLLANDTSLACLVIARAQASAALTTQIRLLCGLTSTATIGATLFADTFTANSRQRIGPALDEVEAAPMQGGLPASTGIGQGFVSGRRIGAEIL